MFKKNDKILWQNHTVKKLKLEEFYLKAIFLINFYESKN